MKNVYEQRVLESGTPVAGALAALGEAVRVAKLVAEMMAHVGDQNGILWANRAVTWHDAWKRALEQLAADEEARDDNERAVGL